MGTCRRDFKKIRLFFPDEGLNISEAGYCLWPSGNAAMLPLSACVIVYCFALVYVQKRYRKCLSE
ncbi:hypothetical protein CTZ29_06120 [Bacillus halotolerans]|nr:hypothetical protein CTZ29_06120 [Bacillus halotolerans]